MIHDVAPQGYRQDFYLQYGLKKGESIEDVVWRHRELRMNALNIIRKAEWLARKKGAR